MEPWRATRVGLGAAVLALLGLAAAGCGDDDSAGGDWPVRQAPASAAATGATGADRYAGLADPHIAAYLRGIDVIGAKYQVTATRNTVEERAASSADLRETLCAPDGDDGYRPSTEGRYATGLIIEAGAEEVGVARDAVPLFAKEVLDLGESTLCVPN